MTTSSRTTQGTTDKTTFGDDDDDDSVSTVLVSNHILFIALYSSLVTILCIAILVALCLVIRWKNSYTLANSSEEGSNSDSTSSDLPMLRGLRGKKKSDFSPKNLYSKKDSPASPPPLLPPDLSLGRRSASALGPKPKLNPSANPASPKHWFGKHSEETTKAVVKKGNDWY